LRRKKGGVGSVTPKKWVTSWTFGVEGPLNLRTHLRGKKQELKKKLTWRVKGATGRRRSDANRAQQTKKKTMIGKKKGGNYLLSPSQGQKGGESPV